MNRQRLLTVALVSLIALTAVAVAAQTPRRRPPVGRASAKPTPTPAPVAQPTPRTPETASPTVATVNDVTITAADIEAEAAYAITNDPDPYVHSFYEDREKEIREARQRAVDARINSMMIAAEAKKRGLTGEEFLSREVTSRIPPPNEAEVVAIYNSNRSQIGSASLEQARPEIIKFIKSQRGEQLYGTMINRLKLTNTVVKHADVNTPGLPTGSVLAAVNGQPLRIDSINERMKAYIYKLEMTIYLARKAALDRRINDLVLIAEANKRQIGSEVIIRTEVTEKIKPPTEAEIAKFYDENKANINGDLASTRTGIAAFLEEQQEDRLQKALAERLRATSKLNIILSEPEPPVQNVSPGSGVWRGDPNAAVTIIEFTDFQCSACGAMYPILEDVLKSYGNRVRFVVRNFPLTLVHANAYRSAQAAGAANAQGKFWEYIDILFKNQNALEDASLRKYATQVGLDRKRFDAELDGGKYDADVRRDIDEGEMYGIESTPTIFINGVRLLAPEFSADGLRAAIDRAFRRAAAGSSGGRP